ncbi:methyl-accepting chemotaxis protein [Formivibrio citricus]|uniref:Methyl-accepting chemotaxis protein n=1 Tax=Formivibrio citricus TaxID=83765 RepID=A0A1I4W7H3_9NEIS|nr:methyl-accepting chemotaxis protein [Formivibrio citricus]SFN09581.1 methyl-accepting chemotaxis protein [Formivibrio citricus]
MGIANRIIMILTIALLSLLGVGGYALWGLGAAQTRFEYVQENTVPSVKALDEARVSVDQIRIAVRDHLLAENTAEKEAAEKHIAEHYQLALKNLNRYEKELLSDDTDKKMTEADKASLARYMSIVKTLLQKSDAKDTHGVHVMLLPTGEFSQTARGLTKNLADHMDYNWKLAEGLRKDNAAAYARAKWIQVSAILLALAVVGTLGYLVAKEIRFRMNRLQDMMKQVNQSLDFTLRIPVARLDELGASADAFNKLLERLQGNLRSVAAGAQSVAAAANQMATTSTQVARASQQQSEAASGMAATVEEMTVSINHVADRAQEANRISSESGKLANMGEQVIGQTASDIQDIATTVNEAADLIHSLEQHSQQISNVVSVIKEVADQTNLLALNAAIEAARAGEQGRGFAVVADEVRKLAERTASSTQEIASTIDTMRNSAGNAVASMQGVVAKVGKGVEQAQVANDSIRQIGEGSRNAVGMVEEITTAIREQGTATNNIAIQVEKIAQMSEESSAAAEESARAAHDLDRLAGEMHDIVAAYRL